MEDSAVSPSVKKNTRRAPSLRAFRFMFGGEGGTSIPSNPQRKKMKEEYQGTIGKGMIDPENFPYWLLLQKERADRLAKRIYALCEKHNLAAVLPPLSGEQEKYLKILNAAFIRWILSEYAGTGNAWKEDNTRALILTVFAPEISTFFADLLLVVSRTQLSTRSCCTQTIRRTLFFSVVSAYLKKEKCPTFKTDKFEGD